MSEGEETRARSGTALGAWFCALASVGGCHTRSPELQAELEFPIAYSLIVDDEVGVFDSNATEAVSERHRLATETVAEAAMAHAERFAFEVDPLADMGGAKQQVRRLGWRLYGRSLRDDEVVRLVEVCDATPQENNDDE